MCHNSVIFLPHCDAYITFFISPILHIHKSAGSEKAAIGYPGILQKQEFFMQVFLYISNFIVPFIILAVVVYGLLRGVNVYDTFIRGAKSGFLTVIRIMPTLIGLMAAVGILRASGFLDFLAALIGQFTAQIGFPGELVPLSVVKMFSSSAATGLLLDIYKEYGTDSELGLIASISMCCTETIFYTMSVYFMTAGIRRSRYTLAGAMIATFAGLAASVVFARTVF